jgi:putative membrane protein insertion efficiency factor
MRNLSIAAASGLLARCAVGAVRIYQRFLSGLKPPTCRYYPTCSEYAARAILHCGLARGCLLAAWRLLRCNPFAAGGYDPGPWADVDTGDYCPPSTAAGQSDSTQVTT